MYVGLALLLAAAALALLVSTATTFARSAMSGALTGSVVSVLDQILLVLIIVELLATVQVSFREHTIVPEPFLVVGLIAGIRRALVLTAEFSTLVDAERADAFRNAMIELALLTVFIIALVFALRLLRRPNRRAAVRKAA